MEEAIVVKYIRVTEVNYCKKLRKYDQIWIIMIATCLDCISYRRSDLVMPSITGAVKHIN